MNKRSIFYFLCFGFVALIILVGAVMLLRNWLTTPQPNEIEVVSNVNSNQISNKVFEPISNKKGEKDEKLQRETDALIPLFGKTMRIVPVFIVDEPILKSGSETQKGVAYTSCENKNEPTIYVKKVFYQKNNQKQLINILKHELVHAWFCQQGTKAGHDERFRKKFTEVGGFGN